MSSRFREQMFRSSVSNNKAGGAESLSDALEYVYVADDAHLISELSKCPCFTKNVDDVGDDKDALVCNRGRLPLPEEISMQHYELRRVFWGNIMVSDMFPDVMVSAENALFLAPLKSGESNPDTLDYVALASHMRLAQTMALSLHLSAMDLSRLVNVVATNYTVHRLHEKGWAECVQTILHQAACGGYRIVDSNGLYRYLQSKKVQDYQTSDYPKYLSEQLLLEEDHSQSRLDFTSSERLNTPHLTVYTAMIRRMMKAVTVPLSTITHFMKLYRPRGMSKMYVNKECGDLLRDMLMMNLQPFLLALLSRYIAGQYKDGTPMTHDIEQAIRMGLPEAANIEHIRNLESFFFMRSPKKDEVAPVDDTVVGEPNKVLINVINPILESLHNAILCFGQNIDDEDLKGLDVADCKDIANAMKTQWESFFRCLDMPLGENEGRMLFTKYVAYLLDLIIKGAVANMIERKRCELQECDLLTCYTITRYSNIIEVYRDKFDMSMRTNDVGAVYLLEAAHYLVTLDESVKAKKSMAFLTAKLNGLQPRNMMSLYNDVKKGMNDIGKSTFTDLVLQLLMQRRPATAAADLASEILNFRRPRQLANLHTLTKGVRDHIVSRLKLSLKIADQGDEFAVDEVDNDSVPLSPHGLGSPRVPAPASVRPRSERPLGTDKVFNMGVAVAEGL